MNYLIVLLSYSNLSGIFGKSKSERLLLNDPSVLADRLGRLENSVTILKQTVATQNAELQIQKTTIQALEQENTKLSIQNQHHTSDIQQLLNSVSNHGKNIQIKPKLFRLSLFLLAIVLAVLLRFTDSAYICER
jgi:hypothetical protein